MSERKRRSGISSDKTGGGPPDNNNNNNNSVKKKKKKKTTKKPNGKPIQIYPPDAPDGFFLFSLSFVLFQLGFGFFFNVTTCDGIDWMNMSLRLAANDSFSGRQGCAAELRKAEVKGSRERERVNK